MRARTIVPLVLHRVVVERPQDFEDITVPTLEMILERVGGNWVAIDSTGDAVGQTEQGWLLTFDDGYASDYEVVFPRLQTRRQQACFFLIADRIGKPGYLNWNQVREMRRHGMAFGSHGLSHRDMTAMPPKEVRREFSVSRACIEEELGEAVRVFSFPFGYYSHDLIRMAREEGFAVCCTSAHGVCSAPFDIVPRNSINGSMGHARIARTMEASGWTRCMWGIEDIAKRVAKRCLGEAAYTRLRRSVSG